MPFDTYVLYAYLEQKMMENPNNCAYAEIHSFCKNMEFPKHEYYDLYKKWNKGWRPGVGYPVKKDENG